MKLNISDKIFLFILIFMKNGRKKLKKMKTNLNNDLYGKTEILYTNKNGQTFFENGSKNTIFKTKKVITSPYFQEEYGEPSKQEIKSFKEKRRLHIDKFKTERAKIVNKFEYVFIGTIAFIGLKLLFMNKISYLEELSENYTMYIYYIILMIGYFIISSLKKKVISMRLKAYRNHLVLLYIEKVYSHLTDQETTVSKAITYDNDGFPKNLYSSSLIDLVNITLGQVIFILLMILGYFIF